MSRQDEVTPPSPVTTSAEPGGDDVLLQINLRLRLDEVAELEAKLLRQHPARQPTRKELWALAGRLYDARRVRDRMIEGNLFGEPAWDMLLALYCSPVRGICLSTTSLSHAANAPVATGARWQKTLFDLELIRYGPHMSDDRQRLVGLTDKGKQLMESYLTRLFHADRVFER